MVELTSLALAVAWNAQGDATSGPFVAEVESRFGVRLPAAVNAAVRSGPWLALWLGPDSWLLVAEAPLADGLASPRGFDACRDALIAQGGALFDVSASRVAFVVQGLQVEAVLAKHCPLDFHQQAFPVGACAQSLFDHVNALFHRTGPQAFTVMVARSLAHEVAEALSRT